MSTFSLMLDEQQLKYLAKLRGTKVKAMPSSGRTRVTGEEYFEINKEHSFSQASVNRMVKSMGLPENFIQLEREKIINNFLISETL